jgi:hypothetical protein
MNRKMYGKPERDERYEERDDADVTIPARKHCEKQGAHQRYKRD